MAVTVKVFNHLANNFETYTKELNDTMPYASPGSLTVDEFRGSSNSNIIWTDRRLMECWSTLRRSWGQPIVVWFAFKRIWEGGHSDQSQHYAGKAIDMAQGLQNPELANLRQLANDINCFVYVEPANLAPTWIHVDTRVLPAACQFGYPTLRMGAKNTYVFTLQDALNALGYSTGSLDGVFGPATERAVKEFQASERLLQDGIVGCPTWRALTRRAKGIGLTPSVINP